MPTCSCVAGRPLMGQQRPAQAQNKRSRADDQCPSRAAPPHGRQDSSVRCARARHTTAAAIGPRNSGPQRPKNAPGARHDSIQPRRQTHSPRTPQVCEQVAVERRAHCASVRRVEHFFPRDAATGVHRGRCSRGMLPQRAAGVVLSQGQPAAFFRPSMSSAAALLAAPLMRARRMTVNFVQHTRAPRQTTAESAMSLAAGLFFPSLRLLCRSRAFRTTAHHRRPCQAVGRLGRDASERERAERVAAAQWLVLCVTTRRRFTP